MNPEPPSLALTNRSDPRNLALMSDGSPKTVLHVLQSGSTYLESKQVENPRLVCEMLLSRLLGCPRLELYLKHELVLSDKRLDAMRRGIKRAGSGEPVQYILGSTGFMDSIFKVDSRALIPRPETEELVRYMLACDSLWQHESPAVVDVGTGSGCIALSLAAVHPNAKYLAIDTSEDALALARENAASLNLTEHVRFVNADLSDIVDPESLDAIVANLPYIPTAECDQLESIVRDHEPRSALDGGPDGLDIIRSIVQDACIVLKSGGMLFLEIGDKQGRRVMELLKSCGFADVVLIKDLSDRERIVSGCLQL